MEKDYEIVSLTNGKNEKEDFEVIMTFQVEDNDYAALLPVNSDDAEVLLFRVETYEDETEFTMIEDEEEFDIVAESYYQFLEK